MGKRKKMKPSIARKVMKSSKAREEEERHERAQAFLADYNAVVAKHRIEFEADLSIQPNGITPRLRLKEVTAQKVASWPEAQRQNLETRKECSHDLSDNVDACKICGLEKDNWGENAKGVTPEYEERKLKEIETAGEPKEAGTPEEAKEEKTK